MDFPQTRYAVVVALLTSGIVPGQLAGDAWKDLLAQGRYAAGTDNAKSEQLLLKALHEAERFGAKDWRIGVTLESLGQTYMAEKKFAEAEDALKRALPIVTDVNGEDSAEAADIAFDRAKLYYESGRPSDALPLSREALSVRERLFGGTSNETADALCLEGDALRQVRNYGEAEGPLRRCADIREMDGGIASPALADALHSLALNYMGEKKYDLAEPRFRLAEKIRENKFGLTSPLLAQTMEDHAALLKLMGRQRDADRLILLASAIRRNEKKNAR